VSSRYNLRSTGEAYFACAQTRLDYMDASSLGDGLASMVLEFALHRLPVKSSSEDEVHQLFSFSEYPFGQTLAAIGVTPSGRLAVVYASGEVFWTAQGLLVANGKFRRVSYDMDGGTGQVSVTLDGPKVVDEAAATPTFAIPTGGSLAKFMLFNGNDGLARCECSIRSAQAYILFSGSGTTKAVDWPIDEGAGQTAAATTSGSSDSPNQDFSLTADWTLVPPAMPWGASPIGSSLTAFKWVLVSDYRRRNMPVTTYRRRS